MTLHAPEGPHADAFRRLRSAVLLMMRANDAKIVAVTSANAGEGKSTVAANLAVTLAQAGNTVCLVSADVRRPTLDQFFQVPGHTGLMDVLDGSVLLDEAMVQVAGLSLLTSGRPHSTPTDLLQSALMENTMATLRSTFDFTVVDTPPVLAVADVLGMAGMLDAVVFVVSASETTEADITAAETELRNVGANITGAIMNRSMVSTSRYNAYYRQSTKKHGRARKTGRAQQAGEPEPRGRGRAAGASEPLKGAREPRSRAGLVADGNSTSPAEGSECSSDGSDGRTVAVGSPRVNVRPCLTTLCTVGTRSGESAARAC